MTGALPFAIIGLGAIMGGGGIIMGGPDIVGGGGIIMGGPDIVGIMGAGAGLMMTISAGERLAESITLGLVRVARPAPTRESSTSGEPAPTRESSSSRGEPVNLSSLM